MFCSKFKIAALVAAMLALVLGACVDTEIPVAAKLAATSKKGGWTAGIGVGKKSAALKAAANGQALACGNDLNNDPNCNAKGPNGQLGCGQDDGMCHLYIDEEICTPDDDPSAALPCGVVTCGSDAECNDNDANNVDSCEFTVNSANKGYGFCMHWFKQCTIWANTPCVATGLTTCKNNVCSCNAVKKDAAQTEVCNALDDNCDGKTDEGFNVGLACDGTDTDSCKNGTYACSGDKLSAVCLNETKVDIKETCDGVDEDCDGKIDQTFTDLGMACDGSDADACKNGKVVCNSTDKSKTLCDEVGKNVSETCNGSDDTCEGSTDEGCDDDGDLFCDINMKMSKGALCSKSKIPADTSSVNGDDCNDSDKFVYAGATEMCNSVDDNCNGAIDEGYKLTESCDNGMMGICLLTGTYSSCAANGSAAVCDAKKGTAAIAEVCNGLDDTCDGKTDEGCDDDGDLYCDAAMKVAKGAACSKSTIPSDSSQVSGDDCDDAVKTTNKGGTEICDGQDNNCSGATDEGCDDDGDLFCDSKMKMAKGALCSKSAIPTDTSVVSGDDCADDDKAQNPGVTDICDGADNNCDTKIDVKPDGSAACDGWANAIQVACGDTVTLDMVANNPNGTDTVESYTCPTSGGLMITKAGLVATELVIAPVMPSGAKSWSVQIMSANGVTGFLLRGGKSAIDVKSKSVGALDANTGKGCVGYGFATTTKNGSLSGGVAGDVAAFDAKINTSAKFKVVCQ